MPSTVARVVVYFAALIAAVLVPVGGAFVFDWWKPQVLGDFIDHHLIGVLVGIGICSVLYAVAMFQGGAWAARIRPPSGVLAVSADELRARLLAINDLNLPFHVRPERPGRLVAEWRIADAHWAGILQAGGLTMMHRVHLRLDSASRWVRAVDESKAISWRGGLGSAGFSFAYFRGIDFFEYAREAEVGLRFTESGWKAGLAYQYRFDLSEMKNPLIEVITASGWTFAPVVLFVRWLGG